MDVKTCTQSISRPIRPASLLARAMASDRPQDRLDLCDRAALIRRLTRVADANQGRYRAALTVLEITNLAEIEALTGRSGAQHAEDVLGQRLLAAASSDELAARLHRNRFCVVIPRCGEEALEFANHLIATMAQPILFDKTLIYVSIDAVVQDFPLANLHIAQPASSIHGRRHGFDTALAESNGHY
ncbi:MAG TPA: diguanylate cyclase [Usitatibacter sp.]|nr:diguanylate cyclase [Usitatibacter sp.]